MSTTLPLYWNLSSADKEERIDASVKLVYSVLEFQAQFAGSVSPAENISVDGSEEDSEQEKTNELDELNAEDVRYAIRRLARGLASPRESSRLGFAVALTEVSLLDPIPICNSVDNLHLRSFSLVLPQFRPSK